MGSPETCREFVQRVGPNGGPSLENGTPMPLDECGACGRSESDHAIPPAPADDASGAEAWAGGAILAILGVYRDEMPHDAVAALQTLADRLGHPLAPLPARPTTAADAVVEAARAAFIAYHRDFYGPAKWDYEAEWIRRTATPNDPIVARWQRIARAALRGKE